MHAALLLLASTVVGVDWGYRPLPTGGIEYIVQLEPQALDDLAAGGGEIVSHVPPELYDIRKFRLTVGKQKLPHGGRVAAPAKQQTAADGVQVTPAALLGGGNEHVVELDRPSIDQMKRALDLVYEVENVRRYRIRLLPAPPPTRVEQVSAAMAEPTPVEPTRAVTTPRPSEVASPRPSPMPMETELEAAPPFVPTGAVRDPNLLRGSPREEASREDTPREATGAAKAAGAEPTRSATAQAAKISAPAPKTISPEPQTVAPEPLMIDVAPSADRSPRPLKSGEEPAATPTQPAQKPRSVDARPLDAFPPPTLPKASDVETKPEERHEPTPQQSRDPFSGDVQLRETPQRTEEPMPKAKPAAAPRGQAAEWPPTNSPAADSAPSKAKEPSQSGFGGTPVEDNPFASPPAVPAAAEVKVTPEPKAPDGLSPAVVPQSPATERTSPGATDELHAGAPQRVPGPLTERRETPDQGAAPPASGTASDPFAPAGNNPLRESQNDAPPAGLRSPPGTGFGVGTDPPTSSRPVAAPTESPSPPDRARGDAPASEIMPPAFGGFPPLSTATPSAQAAKPGEETKASPANSNQSNDPFPSAFGGTAPGGVNLPLGETSAKTADGPPNSSASPARTDPFPSFGAPPNNAGSPGNSLSGASPDSASLRSPQASETRAAPDGFSNNNGSSQPPILPRNGFGDEAGPGSRPANDRPLADRPIGAVADHRDEPTGPATTAPAPVDKKPWWALTGAMVVLFGSLGGNVYLGWMNWDLRRQYAALLDTFKQQRANKSRVGGSGTA